MQAPSTAARAHPTIPVLDPPALCCWGTGPPPARRPAGLPHSPSSSVSFRKIHLPMGLENGGSVCLPVTAGAWRPQPSHRRGSDLTHVPQGPTPMRPTRQAGTEEGSGSAPRRTPGYKRGESSSPRAQVGQKSRTNGQDWAASQGRATPLSPPQQGLMSCSAAAGRAPAGEPDPRPASPNVQDPDKPLGLWETRTITISQGWSAGPILSYR